MAALEMGVLEVAYTYTEKGKSEATTTGKVAEILEARYHVMQTFFELRKERIAQYVADGMANALQDLLSGRSVRQSPTYGAEQKIEAEFRAFLDANEMQKLAMLVFNPATREGTAGGSPISAAALRGVNHRKKHPYAKANKSRAAFVDTGLYRSSFRAKVNL